MAYGHLRLFLTNFPSLYVHSCTLPKSPFQSDVAEHLFYFRRYYCCFSFGLVVSFQVINEENMGDFKRRA